MANFIYSTHTNHVNYVEYRRVEGATYNEEVKNFKVNGGHGLCNKNFVTAEGVVTRVDSDETMGWLRSLPAFKKDVDQGFIRFSTSEENPAKIAKDMKAKDGSAPLTPKDYEPIGKDKFSYQNSTSIAAKNTL